MLRNADRFRRGSRFKRGRRFRRIDRKPDKERKEEQSENFLDGWRSRAVLFLASQCITLFGSTLVQMAVVWYVTLETGSGVWVSAVSVSSYLPQFLISFPGGVWADRRNRKQLIIGADMATAAVTLLLIWLLPFLESGAGEGREGWILAGLLVSRVYGDTYGYLTAVELAGFAGMAAGGLLMSLWGGFGRREKTLSLGLAAFGLASALMGITEEFGLYLILMAFYGVALTVVQTAVTTLLQEQADRAVQGRIFGMQSSMYAGFLPLGMVVFGPLADVVSLQWIMIGAGGALAVLAALTGGSGGAEEEK